jgi:phage gpG-like protein
VAVSVRGDFAKLRTLVRSVGKAATPQWWTKLNKNLAQEARHQMVQGFLAHRDPYGVPWKPTHRGGQILRLSARLMNSVQTQADAKAFQLFTIVIYARIHQQGGVIKAKRNGLLLRRGWLKFQVTVRGKRQWVQVKQVTIPARPFMPFRNRIGPIWLAGFHRVVAAQVGKTLKQP